MGELKELMSICQEYLTALRLELTNKLTTEPKRKMELAAYFTHCNLSPPHAILALRSAMTTAFKLQLMKSAGAFARRLLELNPKPEFATKARQVRLELREGQSEKFATKAPAGVRLARARGQKCLHAPHARTCTHAHMHTCTASRPPHNHPLT